MKMKLTIPSIFLAALLAIGCSNKEDNLNIVPKPASVEMKSGMFEIQPGLEIISNNVFCAEYLKEYLMYAPGIDLNDASNENGRGISSVIVPLENTDIWKEYGKKKNCILLSCDENFKLENYTNDENEPSEAYSINVNRKNVTINAASQSGLYYGIQTLLQMLPAEVYCKKAEEEATDNWTIPAAEIKDYPKYAWRGYMLDVSRQFFDIDFCYKLVDWMSAHKLNKFHWHLSDDNGWRIEIKSHPELTEKGAWRGPGEVLPESYGSGKKRYGGFYTQEEVAKFIKYAQDRGIEIIPEIDMPGHSKAIVSVYPWAGCTNPSEFVSVNGETKNILCVSNEKVYSLIDDIIGELAELFPGKYMHIGGDEVQFKNWEECPHCQAFLKENGWDDERELQRYFVRKMDEIVSAHGKVMCGWSEIADMDVKNNKGRNEDEIQRTFSDQTLLWAWKENTNCVDMLKTGYPVIFQIAQYSYFDMKQSEFERGHTWAAIVPLEKAYAINPEKMIDSLSVVEYGKPASEKEKSCIKGIQCGLWCELLNKPARFAEYQLFPRACALAESAWTNEADKNYEDFYKRMLNKHFERLYNMGIAFRVEPPFVEYKDGKLIGKSDYIIRYTCDGGSTPDASSPVMDGPVETDTPNIYRFAAFYKDDLKSITMMARDIAPAEYLNPETSIETSFKSEVNGFPMSNITDYDFNTYWRTERMARKGDYITYNFNEAVECSRIVIESGIPNIDMYGITDGYAEYTCDGNTWVKGGDFIENTAIIDNRENKLKIKAVRIIFTDANDGLNVSVQDLRIEK